MNGNWRFVFEKDRQKLKKYFKREIVSPVYVRIYTVNKHGTIKYFQVSGNEEPFSSIAIKDDILEEQIKKDFPFIRNAEL